MIDFTLKTIPEYNKQDITIDLIISIFSHPTTTHFDT